MNILQYCIRKHKPYIYIFINNSKKQKKIVITYTYKKKVNTTEISNRWNTKTKSTFLIK